MSSMSALPRFSDRCRWWMWYVRFRAWEILHPTEARRRRRAMQALSSSIAEYFYGEASQ